MNISTRKIVVAGMMIAVSAILGITGLGYFPVPNLTNDATIMHVPVIIGAVLEGPVVGLLVGLIFGLNAYTRYLGLPFFVDQPAWVPIVILFLPRLFIGLVAGWVYLALRRGNQIVALTAASVLGTLTNTVMVLGIAIGLGLLPVAAIAATIPQAIFEMIVAAVITIAVVAAWKQIETGRGGSSI
ncbi:MAG: ECF transporter S component [Caldilineaceae bacterium]|nr:ECF transporter S component [Caldilineaceae bacterium]